MLNIIIVWVQFKCMSLLRINNCILSGYGNNSASANNKKLGNLSLQEVQQVAAEKAELVKSWSVKTYKVDL